MKLKTVHDQSADEVWIATALLAPGKSLPRPISALKEIEAIVPPQEGLVDANFGLAYTSMHTLPSTASPIGPPSPNDYRMLYETRPKYRRLFRFGDSYHPQRQGKIKSRSP